MANLLNITDAASLGIHAMLLLAVDDTVLVSAKDLAARIHASEAHMSKVMQRLAKEDLVVSTRGPHGGFRLSRPAADISLLDIYQAIEGRVSPSSCLLDEPLCDGQCCIFGGFLSNFSRAFIEHIQTTKLSHLCEGVRFNNGDS